MDVECESDSRQELRLDRSLGYVECAREGRSSHGVSTGIFRKDRSFTLKKGRILKKTEDSEISTITLQRYLT